MRVVVCVGSREVAREVARVELEPQQAVHQTAVRLADQLAARLESLRDNESRRPFYHYQNLYHDPKGASEGVSVIPSPLAQGPADPLVRAYFQIDSAGQLPLPTLNEEVAELNAVEVLSGQRTIQKELQSAAAQFVGALAPRPASQPPSQQVRAQVNAPAQQGVAPAQPGQQKPQQQLEVLEPGAYAQNVQASKLYVDIKNRQNKESSSDMVSTRSLPTAKGDVVVRVGPFQWRTIGIGGVLTLVALREVVTPDGRLTQGFVMSAGAVADWLGGLKEATFPVRLESGSPKRVTETSVPIPGAEWKISCDPTRVWAAAQAQARRVEARFQRGFLVGVSTACFAALCVVFIVWQTDRLARQRSQFAASAAHELRTPLAGLRMYAEMLAEGLGDPARAKDYARRLATEAERLGRVVANVLGFTRLERGTLQIHAEPGDFAAAVRECVARQQPALEAAGARVELAIADNLPPVKFDRDAVAQIVQNLLDNAEKHTRNAVDRTIHVAAVAAGKTITFTVTDHGPGIPPDVRRRLFRPFERGNHADAPAGLGLGLVLVQALVQAHGGRITYADAPGGGARFTVSFPA